MSSRNLGRFFSSSIAVTSMGRYDLYCLQLTSGMWLNRIQETSPLCSLIPVFSFLFCLKLVTILNSFPRFYSLYTPCERGWHRTVSASFGFLRKLGTNLQNRQYNYFFRAFLQTNEVRSGRGALDTRHEWRHVTRLCVSPSSLLAQEKASPIYFQPICQSLNATTWQYSINENTVGYLPTHLPVLLFLNPVLQMQS